MYLYVHLGVRGEGREFDFHQTLQSSVTIKYLPQGFYSCTIIGGLAQFAGQPFFLMSSLILIF